MTDTPDERRRPLARKRFGQHFLRDTRVLDDIVRALGSIESRVVVEIGPGRGALTDRLVRHAASLKAIEIDRDLVALLRARYAGMRHVEIIEGDVLDMSLGDIAGNDYVLAGNVPYYITTPIIFKALERPRPAVAVYLVQREVADRLSAPPGDKQYGALSVNVQAVARVERIRTVPPSAFVPPPKVDSAVVRVVPRDDPVVAPELEDKYRRFVQAAFGLRRKQLVRILRSVASLSAERALEVIESCGLQPSVRPETLTAEEFARLVAAV